MTSGDIRRNWDAFSTRYFEVLRIHLIRGSLFTDHDKRGMSQAAIIKRSHGAAALAKRGSITLLRSTDLPVAGIRTVGDLFEAATAPIARPLARLADSHRMVAFATGNPRVSLVAAGVDS